MGETEKALSCFETAEKVETDNLALYLSWAECLYNAGMYVDSIDKLKIAEKLSPDDVTMEYYMALALSKSGNVFDAINYMKKALKKHPKDLTMISDLGKLFLQSKDYDKAIKRIEESSFTEEQKKLLTDQAAANRDLAISQAQAEADQTTKNRAARSGFDSAVRASKKNRKAVKEVDDIL